MTQSLPPRRASDLAGNEDKGYIELALGQQCQRLGTAEAGHRVIAEDDVPGLALQRVFEGVRRGGTPALRVIAAAPQLAEQQSRVVLRVLDEEDLYRPGRLYHPCSVSRPCAPAPLR